MLQKIQRISIPEGGRGRGFTTGKLETALQGGGSCFWVPESAVKTGRLYVHKNGVHRLGQDYYGAGEAVVNVNSYASNGDRMIIPIDDILTDQNDLPRSIRIETPPDKLAYVDGERIDLTGIVVRAYKGNGEVWTSQDYPDGVIPLEKLIYNPKTALLDDTARVLTVEAGQSGINVSVDGVTYVRKTSGEIVPATYYDVDLNTVEGTKGKLYVVGFYDDVYEQINPITIHCWELRTSDVWVSGSATVNENSTWCRMYPIGSSPGGYPDIWSGGLNVGGSVPDLREISTNVPIMSVKQIIAQWGSTAAFYSFWAHNNRFVTVAWPRPMDNYRLEATFDITVSEAPGPSGHSGSSHSSQPTGGN